MSHSLPQARIGFGSSYFCHLLTFCRASKPAPIVSEEHTSSLESLIIKRAKEDKWDDVIERDSRAMADTAAELGAADGR